MSGPSGGDNDIEDTPEQRHLAEVAAEKWNYAQRELAPLMEHYMGEVDSMTDPSKESYIRGRTMQGVQQTGSELNDQAGAQLAEAGIDPSSGRYQGAMGDVGLDVAEAGGETLGRAEFEQEGQQLKGMQNIVALGQGKSGQAQAGLSGVAETAASDARSAAVGEFNRNSANLQLLGQVAGAGTRYGLEGLGNDSPGLGTDGGVSQTAIDSSRDLYGY